MSEDRTGQQAKQLILWMGICGVVWLFDAIGWFNWPKKIVENLLSPVEQFSYIIATSVQTPIETISFYKSGVERIVDLEARLAEKLVTQAQVDALIAENQSLREQMEAPLPGEWKMIPAAVLGYQNGELIIKAGSVEGVREGMTVVYKEIFIGKVTKVSQSISEVMVVTHSESKVAAKVSGRNLNGLVINTNGLIVLDQILQGSTIQEGEVVVSSGTDMVAPLLTIGRVSQIISDQSDIFKRVLVTPALNPSDLSQVFVISMYTEVNR